jgi:hypothetical protein
MAADAIMAEPCQKQTGGYRGKMNRLKTLLIFTLCLFTLLSCGIEDIPYLPQVSESGIKRELTSKAEITLLSLTGIATGYIIYYKIYIISSEFGTVPELISNNSRIANDYNTLSRFTDPTNASSIPTLITFSNSGFYELEIDTLTIRKTILSTSGGIFNIEFPLTPGEKPYIYNGTEYPLYRSNGGGVFNPKPDRYFFSSTDLNDYANAISTINADVSGQNGVSEFAYASMYIVAVGINQNFSRVYGKPTFINIFKLPDSN